MQLTAGQMEISFEIWETGTYNPVLRTDFYKRVVRRRITQTPAQGGEYGEALSPVVPFYDRDAPGEEKAYNLHCRLVNEAGGTASDFDVSIKLAEIGEVI